MNEKDYIRATNRVKVSAALTLMRDVLAGDEYGITATERVSITHLLKQAEDKLFSSFDIQEEGT